MVFGTVLFQIFSTLREVLSQCFFMVDWQQFLSEDNFWIAWDKVRRNNGCAGVDGETIAQFKAQAERNLQQLRRSLKRGTYRPLPLRSRQAEQRQQRVIKPDAPMVYRSDLPPQPTQMQQALLAAIQTSQQIAPPLIAPPLIAPPLYVVMGYRVREDKQVQITSQELEWRSGMSTVYLVQQGSWLRKEQGRFLVQRAGETGGTEMPIREVERILVMGNVQITTQAVAVCLEEQIPVIFMSQMGDYKGHLWSSEFCDLPTAAAQFGRRHDPGFQLEVARGVLRGKLTNSRHLLLRLNRKRKVSGLAAKIQRIDQHIAALPKTDDLNVMRGHEGAGARLYFEALGQLIVNPGFSLTGRSRRPPKDPVNSLLSFGYTLLFNNVLSLILAEGLNPYLGNLHRSERKELHLAFDLMEEWRSPIVDSLVMVLVNKKILRPTDFTFPNAEGGIYLIDSARKIFLKYFEERITEEIAHPAVQQPVSYRRAIQLQVQQYKRCLQDSKSYEPFIRAI
jgi:CRISP-associated protein Cas1